MKSTSQRPALDDLRVIDLTTSVAGQYAGKLLAAYGADVILVEPAAGTPTRHVGPFRVTPDGGQESLLFQHLNEGKRSVAVDQGIVDGQQFVRRLAGNSDVLLHGRSDDPFRDDELPQRLISCAIDDFPSGEPYGSWAGTEMIHQALGGNMFLTGETGRTPIYGLGQRAYYAGGTSACIAVLAALLERRDSGRGQRVSTTVFETSAAMTSNLISQFSYSGTFPARNRYLGYHAILECADGWVVLFGVRSWNAVCETFGARELIDDARFTSYDKLMEHWDEACRLLQGCSSALTCEEIVDRGQRRRLNVEQVASLSDVVSSEQWRIREMVQSRCDPDGSIHYGLGPVFRIESAAYLACRRAPAVGADSDDVRTELEVGDAQSDETRPRS